MKTRVLVTGGAGFIGSHVARRLLDRGAEVLILDDLSGGFADNLPAAARWEKISILDPLDRIFAAFQPELVYHLAAYAAEGLSHHIPVFNYQNNVTASVNVFAAAYRARVRHIVFTSSIAVYGEAPAGMVFTEDSPCRPCDPYGVAKLACEQHLEAMRRYYGRPAYTIVRAHNVYGPRQNVSDPYRNVVGIFIARALRGLPLPVFGDGRQTRSFSYIGPVAQAIADAPWVPAAADQTLNLGDDEAHTIEQLAGIVGAAAGLPGAVTCRRPEPSGRPSPGSEARHSERKRASQQGVASHQREAVLLPIERLPPRHEPRHAHCDHTRARAVFPGLFSDPLPLAAGVAEMLAYVRAHPWPPVTPCPSPVEIHDRLPASWAALARGTSPR